ncbi:unnamed protein product [Arctia plantaginis]|uniref:Uncharacterized protein n=1 Tax=Arctia plantaginis TaxID=874455 RepID=A0A8S1ANU5_ARCPL|nr:unnamed protein product [Arctia plantaginis]
MGNAIWNIYSAPSYMIESKAREKDYNNRRWKLKNKVFKCCDLEILNLDNRENREEVVWRENELRHQTINELLKDCKNLTNSQSIKAKKPVLQFANIFTNQQDTGSQLKAQPKKGHILTNEVSYIGYVISSEGIRTDPKKVEAVQKRPTPKSESLTGTQRHCHVDHAEDCKHCDKQESMDFTGLLLWDLTDLLLEGYFFGTLGRCRWKAKGGGKRGDDHDQQQLITWKARRDVKPP